MLHSIGLILPYFLDDDICQAQGYIISFFSLSAVLWSAFIAHTISKTLLSQTNIEKFEKYYLTIGFILPPLCYLTTLYMRYRDTLGWCWIYQTPDANTKSYYIEIMMRMLTYYIPLWIILIYNTFTYIRVVRFIKNNNIEIEDPDIKKTLILKMRIYPIILVICQTPVTLIRFISFNVTPPWWAMVIAGCGTSINGLCNAIAYGITYEVRSQLRNFFSGNKKKEIAMTLNFDESEEIFFNN